MYWISKEWVILLCRIWATLMVPDFAENRFLILEEIVFRFWRKQNRSTEGCSKSFYDFSRFFPDFEENRFLIYKKIVSDFFTILFRFWRKSFFDFGENRFQIFSWFLETRFIKLICIRKNTEKIVCKSRDFNTILSTIYSTIFWVWEVTLYFHIELNKWILDLDVIRSRKYLIK